MKRTFKKENNKWKKEKCAQFKKGHQKKKSVISCTIMKKNN